MVTTDQSVPLKGLRVIEAANSVAVAACGRQFARWGAQVMKVVPSEQEPLSPELACQVESLDSNKQRYVGELTATLAAEADVLITDLPRDMLDIDLADDQWPVLIDISAFGRQGVYAQYEGNVFIAEAMSGFMSVQGERNRAPLRMPGNILAKACGVSAFNAALAAVHKFRRTGVRDHVEVSFMQLLAGIVPTLRTQVDKPEQRDGGPGVSPLGVRLYEFHQTYLSFNFAMKPALSALLDIVGLDETHIPEHLATFADRQDYAQLKAFVEGLPSPFDAHDLFTIISEPPHNSAVGKVLTPLQTISDKQLQALGYWQQQEQSEPGHAVRTGPPARLSRTPALPDVSPSCFSEWQYPKVSPTPGDYDSMAPPLRGIRILDLTQAWIGPFASQTLSDLGAEVIKIESLTKPDVWRKLPPEKPPRMRNPDAQLVNSSCNFNSVNRDKQSLTLDLADPEGKALFLRLLETADVVMENYRPGVMPKLGLSYEVLRKVKPDLVMTSFSAYGNIGPYSGYRGNGTTIEAIAGWDSLFGYADGPPLAMGFYQADAITGLQMAATTLVALSDRDVTGQGQHVQGSMFETAVDYIEEYVMLQSLHDELPRHGNRAADIAPQGVYPCSGQDEWIAISVTSDETWRALCSQLDGLDESLSLQGRLENHDAIDARLTGWTSAQPAQALSRLLQSLGIAAAPVQTTPQLLQDPHLASLGWWHELDHPDLGRHQYAGFPYHFHSARLMSHSASPRLGQHARTLLEQELGLDNQAINQLFADGVSGEQW